MDKLQWFKFSPSSWMMGRIQRCSEIAQARFLRLCCTYWNHRCELEIEEAEIELGEDNFRELLKLKIIKTDGDYLSIDFLDEQFGDIDEVSGKRSEQGLIGNLKRWHKPIYDKFMNGEIDLQTALSIAKGSPPDRTPIAKGSQNIADKTREDKRREDKSDKFILWFNKSMKELRGSGRFKLTNKVKRQFNARVKEGYSDAQFMSAFEAISKDGFHSEKNYQYLTPEFLTRADQLEKWSNAEPVKLEEEKGKGRGGVSMEEMYNQQ